MTHTLATVIATATASLRGGYAQDTVAGRQRWSGADLKGKARRYGASYATQRSKARAALFRAGGQILTIDRGLNVTAVLICTDDHGNAVYATPRGLALPCTAHRCALV